MRELYRRYHLIVHLGVLCALGVGVYSNNFKHDYLLDSSHSILNNPYVRSLKHIPKYFSDPKTLTRYRANADYRPVLQITYALNYRLSGYNTWSWHLVQILLHLICAVALYFFCRSLLKETGGSKEAHSRTSVPFGVALLFVVHPTASGVVNYLHARSSLLTAAFLLPSFVLYMNKFRSAPDPRTPWAAFALYGLALFTKVEAVAALAVYYLYETFRIARARTELEQRGEATPPPPAEFLADVFRAANRSTVSRLWPFLVLTVVYFVIRAVVVEDYVAEARHHERMVPIVYLTTQVVAWWYYVFHWFAPVGLVADHTVFPIFLSPFAPEVMLAVAGWVMVALLVKVHYRKHPQYTFLSVAALALLSPTSSVVPLAEMVNEHRPYLPLALLSIAWVVPGWQYLRRQLQDRRFATGLAVAVLGLLLLSLFSLTWVRNRVFNNELAYYGDLVKKSPSGRAHVNFGLALVRAGRYDKAMEHYRMALKLSPDWHIVHINVGLEYQRRGDQKAASFHFDRAVETERHGGLSLEHRGFLRVLQKAYGPALEDFSNAMRMCVDCFRACRGMATAFAGLGDQEQSLAYAKKCLKLDPKRAENVLASISAPFWERPERFRAGLDFYREIDRLLPGRWWVKHNLGDLAEKLGMQTEAREFKQQASRLKAGK